MRVVIAPDSFKGSATAAEVAERLARGLQRARPKVEVVQLPVADGGEGTLDAAVSAGWERVPVTVSGPTGEPVETAYARRDDEALVELAACCGLTLLPGGRPEPLTASTRGLGEAMAHALDGGARRLVVGLGGSASTDGGAGLLVGLGARVLDEDGAQVPDGGASLQVAERLELDDLHPGLAGCELVVAVDVDSPLLGIDGAAAVFGPQKGASERHVTQLDTALGQWAQVCRAAGLDRRGQHTATPGAGAAGGAGYGLLLLGATSVPGAELVLDLVRAREQVDGADVVVVGEGRLDEQTLRGKAPAAVARLAASLGVTVVAVAGHVALDAAGLEAAGVRTAYGLTDVEADVARCMSDPGPVLELVGERLAADLPD